MKKTLLLLVSVFIAMSMSAQNVVKTIAELCNYLDIQAEAAELTKVVPTSTVSVTSANGTQFWGYQKGDGSETTMSWNVKPSYNTTLYAPDLSTAGVLDSISAGTMYRAGSGGHIDLGAFTTTAQGKITVYFQPNGTTSRGVQINCTSLATEASLIQVFPDKYAYAVELTIPAGSYAAGDIVIKTVTNTSNIFGVNIENLDSTSPTSINESASDTGVYYNGAQIVNENNLSLLVYNAAGKVVLKANSSVDVQDLAKGIYLVKVEGVKDVLKISR